MLRDAERLKADIIRPPGIAHMSNVTYCDCDDAFFQSISHVDKQLRDKFLKKGEFVDLVKILPRNKYLNDDQHRMEITSKVSLSSRQIRSHQ